MIYHVVTPFSRPQNIAELVEMFGLATNGAPDMIHWHPLCHDQKHVALFPVASWITPMFVRVAPDWNICYGKLNFFLHQWINPDSRYLFLCDDDFYEPGFFQKIDQHANDVIICSMKRGNHLGPGVAHPTTTLIAAFENMRVGMVGLEQIIVSGRIAPRLFFENRTMDADGRMIERVVAQHTIEYVPDAFVLFNKLEPGRWD